MRFKCWETHVFVCLETNNHDNDDDDDDDDDRFELPSLQPPKTSLEPP